MRILLLPIFLLLATGAYAQALHKHIISLDGAGFSRFYAVSFERILFQGGALAGSIQAGITLNGESTSIPGAIHIFTSGGDHHLELSLGGNIFRDKSDPTNTDTFVFLGGMVGYRFQAQAGRLLIAIGVGPLVELDPNPRGSLDVGPIWKATAGLRLGWAL